MFGLLLLFAVLFVIVCCPESNEQNSIDYKNTDQTDYVTWTDILFEEKIGDKKDAKR